MNLSKSSFIGIYFSAGTVHVFLIMVSSFWWTYVSVKASQSLHLDTVRWMAAPCGPAPHTPERCTLPES